MSATPEVSREIPCFSDRMTIDALHITGCGNIVPGACDRDLALSLFLDPGSIAHQTAAQSSHHAYHTVGMDAGTTVYRNSGED